MTRATQIRSAILGLATTLLIASQPIAAMAATPSHEDLQNPEIGIIAQGPCCHAHADSAALQAVNPGVGIIISGPDRPRAQAGTIDELNPEVGIVIQGPCCR